MNSYNTFCSYCNSKIFEYDRTCPQCGAPTINAVFQERKVNNTDKLDPLAPFSILAGVDFEFTFNVKDEYGNPLDLSDSSANWVLCEYGNPTYYVLNLNCDILGNGVFKVKILGKYTKNLFGKYVHTPILVSPNGSEYRIEQGIINIFKGYDL